MMFVSLCKRLVLKRRRFTLLNSNAQLDAFSFNALFSLRCLSSSSSSSGLSLHSNEASSFTISYLTNTLGFSPEAAISASKLRKFKTPEKPDSMLRFLRDNGFSDSQISVTIKRAPQVLMANISQTILPKIEFLYSIGVSKKALPEIISRNPTLLTRSLNQQVIPCYKLLKSFLHSDDKAVKALQRMGGYGLARSKIHLPVNISILREHNVPESTISALLYTNANDICQNAHKFDRDVKKVMEMGFNPSEHTFVRALMMQTRLSLKNMESKIGVFRSWGLSEDQFWAAFRKCPTWVGLSVKLIMKKMKFLVKKMNQQPDVVVRTPLLLAYSLEKRVFPRYVVLRFLFLKGLMKKEISLGSIASLSDKQFLNLYVNKHLQQEPRLLDVLQGKLDMGELGFQFNDGAKLQ